MKLLYITNGINGSGGLERVLSIKASALAEDFGYEVHFMVLNDAHLKPFYTFSDKIIFHSIALTRNPFHYILGLKKLVKQVAPDIVLVCDDGLKGFFIPRILGKGIPIFYERHASINLNSNQSIVGKFIKGLMRYLAKDFEKFIVLTQSNTYEWKLDNILVIPNPLTFYPANTSTLSNKKAILVGSQSYVKGYDMLIEVWKQVTEKHPDWQLNCYGKKDTDNKFELLKAEKNVRGLNFYEAVPCIEDKYLESSVLIMSSRSEGFGMVLIEAMACGVPCVSFDCPSGPRDIINHGEDGFLVEREDVYEMAKKIMLLIENQDTRMAMGAKARIDVRRFSIDKLLTRWDDLFKLYSK